MELPDLDRLSVADKDDLIRAFFAQVKALTAQVDALTAKVADLEGRLAKNLAAQLAAMPREEFAARLLLGVRGDRTTSWGNPFSDLELAALNAWYGRSR